MVLCIQCVCFFFVKADDVMFLRCADDVLQNLGGILCRRTYCSWLQSFLKIQEILKRLHGKSMVDWWLRLIWNPKVDDLESYKVGDLES